MEIADALSRLSPEETDEITDMKFQIHELCPQFSCNTMKRIQESTNTDPELIASTGQVHTGWPTHVKEALEPSVTVLVFPR